MTGVYKTFFTWLSHLKPAWSSRHCYLGTNMRGFLGNENGKLSATKEEWNHCWWKLPLSLRVGWNHPCGASVAFIGGNNQFSMHSALCKEDHFRISAIYFQWTHCHPSSCGEKQHIYWCWTFWGKVSCNHIGLCLCLCLCWCVVFMQILRES